MKCKHTNLCFICDDAIGKTWKRGEVSHRLEVVEIEGTVKVCDKCHALILFPNNIKIPAVECENFYPINHGA